MTRIAHTPWLLGLLCTASWAQATALDPALLGCWRATTIVLHTADGARLEDRSGRSEPTLMEVWIWLNHL